MLTRYVLFDLLRPRRPADAVAVLALTTSDLWPGEDWNFVFGQASLTDRVGVWSLARYGDPDAGDDEYRLFRQRMFKVALHEAGHMLGIAHCTAYECLMNGSNHLAEMDSRPLYLCPQDAPKVWWSCSADPARRYARLIEFAEQQDLTAEATYWRTALERLKVVKH
jgi:archaemetzincin